MNKQDLVLQVSNKVQINQRQADEVISNVLETIVKNVARGEKVTLAGFGTFQKKSRGARKARNPKTGEEIQIPSRNVPKFSAGKSFKQTVNRR